MKPNLPGDWDDKFETNPTDKVDDIAEEAVGQAKGGLNRLFNKLKNSRQKKKIKKGAKKTAKKAAKKTVKSVVRAITRAVGHAVRLAGHAITALLTALAPVIIPIALGLLAIWILTNVMPSWSIKYWFDKVPVNESTEITDNNGMTGSVNAEINRYYDYIAAIGMNQNKYLLDTKEISAGDLFSSVGEYENDPVCTTYNSNWNNDFYEYDLFEGGSSLPEDVFEEAEAIKGYEYGRYSEKKNSPNLNGAVIEISAEENGSGVSYDPNFLTSHEHFDFFVEEAEEGNYILPIPIEYEYNSAEKIKEDDADTIKDHFGREKYFAITGDMLYMLNKVVCGSEKNYPYPFTRPVPTDGDMFDRMYRIKGIDYEKNGLGSVFYYKKDYIYKKDLVWETEQTTKRVYDVIKEAELLELVKECNDDLDEIRDAIISLSAVSENNKASLSDSDMPVPTKEELLLERERVLEKLDELDVELDAVRSDVWYVPALSQKQVVNISKEEIYLLDKVITFAGTYYFDYEYSYRKVAAEREIDGFTNGTRKNREGDLIQEFKMNQVDKWRFEPTPLSIDFSNRGLSYIADYLSEFNVKLPEDNSGMIDKNFFEFAESGLIGSRSEDANLKILEPALQSIAQQTSMDYDLLKAFAAESISKDVPYVEYEVLIDVLEDEANRISYIYNEKTRDHKYPWVDALKEYYGDYFDTQKEVDMKVSNVLQNYHGNSIEFVKYAYGDSELFAEPSVGWGSTEKLKVSLTGEDIDYILGTAKAFAVNYPVHIVDKADLGFWEENYAENMFVNGYYSGYTESEFFNILLVAEDGLPYIGSGRERLTSPFGRRIHPVSGENKFHHGTDIAMPIGTPLIATEEGRVAYVGFIQGYGKYVYVLHRDYMTVYAHCSVINVKKGDSVQKGQVVAMSGNTGASTGPHLHFEIRLNKEPLDYDGMDFTLLENYAKTNKYYMDPEKMFVKIHELPR